MNKFLIVQPWFCGFGHPAQSLINTASAIGRDDRVQYLVSINNSVEPCLNSMNRLKAWGEVHSFSTSDPAGTSKWNTVKALWAICRLWIKGCRYQRIFFFDASLVRLALLWPIFSLVIAVDRVGVLHLHGPEPMNRSWLIRWMVRRFLLRPDVRLYLRTEELAKAWSDSYINVPCGHIRHLPSLEIPDGNGCQYALQPSEQLRFGIVGQVRPGKGIDWLVPLFQENPLIGKLTVAGAFFNEECRERLPVLDGFEGFINCFMPEGEMLEQASAQDYLLMLYDEPWDSRLESAVLYLAARVNRPVIVYSKGWSGRKVREFGCGILAPADHMEVAELMKTLPMPGSAGYAALLDGMDGFRRAHSVESLRDMVLDELIG